MGSGRTEVPPPATARVGPRRLETEGTQPSARASPACLFLTCHPPHPHHPQTSASTVKPLPASKPRRLGCGRGPAWHKAQGPWGPELPLREEPQLRPSGWEFRWGWWPEGPAQPACGPPLGPCLGPLAKSAWHLPGLPEPRIQARKGPSLPGPEQGGPEGQVPEGGACGPRACRHVAGPSLGVLGIKPASAESRLPLQQWGFGGSETIPPGGAGSAARKH